VVLVTHHVEEIPPGFTHVLLLRDGRVAAAGPLEETVTAAALSECFGLSVSLERQGDRWTAAAVPPGTAVPAPVEVSTAD
jgi:iron complex transport system ATP-binding protein